MVPWNVLLYACLTCGYGQPLGGDEMDLVVCAKVSKFDGLGLILPWIEFHRLQGVEKFVLYYEAPARDREASVFASEVMALKSFYDQRGEPQLLEILPQFATMGTIMTSDLQNTGMQAHRTGQIAAFRHCLNRYKDLSEWVALLDVDEYAHVNDRDWHKLINLKAFQGRQAARTSGGNIERKGALRGKKGVNQSVSSDDPQDGQDRDVPYEQDLNEDESPPPVTLVEYLRSIRQYYETKVLGLPSTSVGRPEVLALLDILRSSNATEWMDDFSQGRLAGVYLPLVTMGTTGALLPPLISIATDPISGISDVVFDPRSNATFRRADAQLRRDLGDSYLIDSARLEAVHSHLQEQLGPSPDILAHIDSYFAKPESQSDVDWFAEQMRGQFPADKKMPLLPPFLSDANLRYRSAMQFQAKWDAYLDAWDDYFPLQVLDTIRRLPSPQDGDDMSVVRQLLLKHFPICEGLDLQNLPDEVPYLACKFLDEGIFAESTQLGKTVYWTGQMKRRRSPQQSRHPLGDRGDTVLSGCDFPWVHHCGFLPEGQMPPKWIIGRLNPLYEVRMSHLEGDSLWRRTLGRASWRKGKRMGFMQKWGNLTRNREELWLEIEDKTLAKNWQGPLRAAIRRLRPRPMFFNITLQPSGDRAVVVRKSFRSKCTIGDFLGGVRAMCPPDYPFVVHAMPASLPPPSPVIPGGWCTRVLPKGRDPDFERRHLRLDLYPGKDTDHKLCPGLPEVSCCDYEPEYYPLSNVFTNVSRLLVPETWRVPSICIGCGWNYDQNQGSIRWSS